MKTSTLKYTMVSNKKALNDALRRCREEGPTALDFETTSLVPAEGRARLVSLCNRKCHYLVDFDQIKGGFRAVAHMFKKGSWVVFNAGFELRWMRDAGIDPKVLDLGNLRKAVLGGGGYSLKQIAAWDLGEELNKEEQTGNWGASELTKEQLDYAYRDADITWRLWRYWAGQCDDRHWDGFHMLNNMVPAVIEMEETGILLDPRHHSKLVKEWTRLQAQRIKTIRGLVSEDEVPNINGGGQWSDYFAANIPQNLLSIWPRTDKTGQLSMKNETLKMLAGAAHTDGGNILVTFLDALAEYKTITKYINSFGETLINKSALSKDRRVRARYNIAAARTCRFSCSGPNLQQIPRDKLLLGRETSVRRSFVAGLGRRLVSLDYSGIELRVLALLAGDDQLLADMVEGDVHSEVAAIIAGHAIDKHTKAGKQLRQDAKAVSFGIVYGAAAPGLSMTMRCSVNEAQDYIDFWQDRYTNAFNYRYQMQSEAARTGFIRAVDGGTIYMGKKAGLPKLANYNVQRAAMAVLAKAMARHKATLDAERARGRQTMTRMLSSIHDALIDEVSTKHSKACLRLMKTDMVEGYLDMFPGAPTDRLVEGGIGPNWAELK